jgi:Uma2 family endonuclease
MTEVARQIAPERMPLAEFLAWEEAQPLRHERVGGAVFAMTGGTLNHNRVALNTYSALRRLLGGTTCEAFAVDARVVTPRGDVMYPDVVIACGERRGTDKEIRDPVVVIEILSDSTAARDHGAKRWAYATVPSLAHYVLIAQDRAEAEVASRDGDVWRSVILRELAAGLKLDALGLEVGLAEVLAGRRAAGGGAGGSWRLSDAQRPASALMKPGQEAGRAVDG